MDHRSCRVMLQRALLVAAVVLGPAWAQAAGRGGAGATQPAPSVSTPQPAMAYWKEVLLWPEDSDVLQAGMRALADEKGALLRPSLLVYRPQTPVSRSAVLVFAGGGYKALALGPQSTLGLYGSDVCKWLTGAGITCVIVKYRVPNTGCNWNPKTKRHEQPAIPMALQDAQRALSIVRHNAGAWGIAPDRIGVMGFSAGGHLAVQSSTEFRRRAYAPVDAADRARLRPDFAIPVYPGHLTMAHHNVGPRDSPASRALNTDLTISSDIPPTLLVHAKDDPVDPVHYSEVYAAALREAGVDVTLRLYEDGGHAFGVRRQAKDSDRWMADAMDWLKRIGMR